VLMGDTNLGDAFANPGQPEMAGIVLFFGLAIFFVMQSISIADKLSISGGNWASSKLTGFTQGMRKSVQGNVGRGLMRLGPAQMAKAIADKQEEWRKTPGSRFGLKRIAAAGMRGTGVVAATQAVRGAKFGSDQSVQSVDDEEKKWNR